MRLCKPKINELCLKISLDLALSKHYYVGMMNKTKAPQIADNNPKGHLSHAIARMRLDNAIVSQSPKKGKVYDGLLQLQFAL